jgi:hypothetical protein
VEVQREALVGVFGGSPLRAQLGVSLGILVDGLRLVLVDMPEVPSVALGRALGVGLRGKPACGGTIREALGKLLGPVSGEVGFANSGSIGAGSWVLTEGPSRRLGSVGNGNIGVGWPSSPSFANNGLLSWLLSWLNLKLA